MKPTAEKIKQLAIKRYGDNPHSFGGQRDGFIEGYKQAMQEYAEAKGSCPMCKSLNKVWGDEDDYSDTEPTTAKDEQPQGDERPQYYIDSQMLKQPQPSDEAKSNPVEVSDAEIEKAADEYFKEGIGTSFESYNKEYGKPDFIAGAKWLRDKQ